MDAQSIYTQIQQLPLIGGGIRQRDPAAIKTLQDLYYAVTGSTVYAGCKGCHIKAANYLTSLTLQDLQTMSEKKFVLNKGVSIEWPYRSGQLLMASNINDAKAAEYLINNPTGVQFFADYPQDQDGNVDLSAWYPADDSAKEPEPKSKKQKSEPIAPPIADNEPSLEAQNNDEQPAE